MLAQLTWPSTRLTILPVIQRGELYDREKKVVDLVDDVDEVGEIDRFGDVGVGVSVVAARDVFLGRGGGEDDDGDRAQSVVVLNYGEDFASVEFG
jgi:hypothetical protein